jgi:hypothetical protein
VLEDVTHTVAFGTADGACIRRLGTDDQSKKRGLSVTVSPNQSDPFPGIDIKTGPLKE